MSLLNLPVNITVKKGETSDSLIGKINQEVVKNYIEHIIIVTLILKFLFSYKRLKRIFRLVPRKFARF